MAKSKRDEVYFPFEDLSGLPWSSILYSKEKDCLEHEAGVKAYIQRKIQEVAEINIDKTYAVKPSGSTYWNDRAVDDTAANLARIGGQLKKALKEKEKMRLALLWHRSCRTESG